MFSHMIFFADLLCQLICLFCFKRYVFLEYGLEPKKQRLYFLGSVLLSLLCGAFDENVAMILVVFLSGLNISLARKSHRVSGFFLVIPIAGIANGLVIPLISVVYFYPYFSDSILLLGLPWAITAPGSMLVLAIWFTRLLIIGS